MLSNPIVVLVLLGSVSLSLAQDQAPCFSFCSQHSPLGPPVMCPSDTVKSIPANIATGICVCTGSGTVVCTACGVGLTEAQARVSCHKGLAANSSAPVSTTPSNGGPPPPTTCYTHHAYTEPAAVVGQAVPANIQLKLVDASQLAAIAYCNLGEPPAFKCNNFCSAYPNTELLKVFDPSQLEGIHGYIAVQHLPTDPRIIVAFKGTDPLNKHDLEEDFLLVTPPVELLYFDAMDCVSCKITHVANLLGRSALAYLTDPLVDALNRYQCYRLQIIGHSLGAVMAELFAVPWKQHVDLEVITFGQPRVGNTAWASYIDSIFGNQKFYRVTHRGDPVVLLPPEIEGFRHHKTEYWINDIISTPNSVIIKCTGDEDPNCANSQNVAAVLGPLPAGAILVLSVVAHLNYLMLDIGNC